MNYYANGTAWVAAALKCNLPKGWPPLSRTRATLIGSIVFKMSIVQYFVRIQKKIVREEVEATSTFKRHDFQRTNQLSRKSIVLKTIDRSIST